LSSQQEEKRATLEHLPIVEKMIEFEWEKNLGKDLPNQIERPL